SSHQCSNSPSSDLLRDGSTGVDHVVSQRAEYLCRWPVSKSYSWPATAQRGSWRCGCARTAYCKSCFSQSVAGAFGQDHGGVVQQRPGELCDGAMPPGSDWPIRRTAVVVRYESHGVVGFGGSTVR